MRKIFTLICFLTFSSAFCQKPTLHKLWVGDADNYMQVDTDAVRVERCFNYQGKRHVMQAAYYYRIIGDTFRIIKPEFYDSSDHDYIIKTFTSDQLTLVPLKKEWRTLYLSDIAKEALTFRDRNKVYTDSIRFQKILFSSTTCYGICPEMSFTIDSNKQMKFRGGKYAVREGSYNAVLSDQLYAELLRILAISELDKLKDLNQLNIDAPTYILEVYYNGKTKSFKSFRFSYTATELLNYLIELPKKVELGEAKSGETSFLR